MQRCRNCNKQFGWSKIYKSFFGWIYKPVECDNSNAEHKITIPGRLIFISLTILPVLIYINYLQTFNNYIVSLGFDVYLLLLDSMIIPSFVHIYVSCLVFIYAIKLLSVYLLFVLT